MQTSLLAELRDRVIALETDPMPERVMSIYQLLGGHHKPWIVEMVEKDRFHLELKRMDGEEPVFVGDEEPFGMFLIPFSSTPLFTVLVFHLVSMAKEGSLGPRMLAVHTLGKLAHSLNGYGDILAQYLPGVVSLLYRRLITSRNTTETVVMIECAYRWILGCCSESSLKCKASVPHNPRLPVIKRDLQWIRDTSNRIVSIFSQLGFVGGPSETVREALSRFVYGIWKSCTELVSEHFVVMMTFMIHVTNDDAVFFKRAELLVESTHSVHILMLLQESSQRIAMADANRIVTTLGAFNKCLLLGLILLDKIRNDLYRYCTILEQIKKWWNCGWSEFLDKFKVRPSTCWAGFELYRDMNLVPHKGAIRQLELFATVSLCFESFLPIVKPGSTSLFVHSLMVGTSVHSFLESRYTDGLSKHRTRLGRLLLTHCTKTLSKDWKPAITVHSIGKLVVAMSDRDYSCLMFKMVFPLVYYASCGDDQVSKLSETILAKMARRSEYPSVGDFVYSRMPVIVHNLINCVMEEDSNAPTILLHIVNLVGSGRLESIGLGFAEKIIGDLGQWTPPQKVIPRLNLLGVLVASSPVTVPPPHHPRLSKINQFIRQWKSTETVAKTRNTHDRGFFARLVAVFHHYITCENKYIRLLSCRHLTAALRCSEPSDCSIASTLWPSILTNLSCRDLEEPLFRSFSLLICQLTDMFGDLISTRLGQIYPLLLKHLWTRTEIVLTTFASISRRVKIDRCTREELWNRLFSILNTKTRTRTQTLAHELFGVLSIQFPDEYFWLFNSCFHQQYVPPCTQFDLPTICYAGKSQALGDGTALHRLFEAVKKTHGSSGMRTLAVDQMVPVAGAQ